MDKKTKLILSIIGVAAIVIPLILLLLLSSRNAPVPPALTEKRQIDTRKVEETVTSAVPSPSPTITSIPTPTPTPSPEASPSEGTSSGQ